MHKRVERRDLRDSRSSAFSHVGRRVKGKRQKKGALTRKENATKNAIEFTSDIRSKKHKKGKMLTGSCREVAST